jgi:hypothetical protein
MHSSTESFSQGPAGVNDQRKETASGVWPLESITSSHGTTTDELHEHVWRRLTLGRLDALGICTRNRSSGLGQANDISTDSPSTHLPRCMNVCTVNTAAAWSAQICVLDHRSERMTLAAIHEAANILRHWLDACPIYSNFISRA